MTHLDSGAGIVTDAPKDHDGLGRSFAPTDLLAASVGSCVLTAMGIEAGKRGWNMNDARVEVEKFIAPDAPRRVSKVHVKIWFPPTLSPQEIATLQVAAYNCPVYLSIKDSVEIIYEWMGTCYYAGKVTPPNDPRRSAPEVRAEVQGTGPKLAPRPRLPR
jgi:putative redox protein